MKTKARCVSTKVKTRVYKTIIKTIGVQGIEIWTVPEKAITILVTWARKIHRKICGPLSDRGTWLIRTNGEHNNVYRDTDMVKVIKTERLKWLGLLQRMHNNRIPKVKLGAKLEGKRKAGRPKLRWLKCDRVGLKMKGIK